jgi:hypothetical protein
MAKALKVSAQRASGMVSPVADEKSRSVRAAACEKNALA